ncbi:hypothetical protein M3Y96_00493100 [Aphelenchoides besseyi]|nr:hypothetical protein M3Y96_00493100 [Aphelenchoides besseyi]
MIVFTIICVIIGLVLSDTLFLCFRLVVDDEENRRSPMPRRKKVESLPELEIHSSKNYNNWLNLLRSNSAKKLQARAVKVAESSDLLADFLNNVPLLRKIANSSSKMDRLLLHLSAEIGKKKKKGSLP